MKHIVLVCGFCHEPVGREGGITNELGEETCPHCHVPLILQETDLLSRYRLPVITA